MNDQQTYDPLVELGEIQEEDEDNLDGLERFMDYVNMSLEEDGVSGMDIVDHMSKIC